MNDLTRAVLDALRERHTLERGWLYAEEVWCVPDSSWPDTLRRTPDGVYTGWSRSIDAYAMALWPSMRYERVAYEVKANRGDFLSELSDPGKRHYAMCLSNRMYFVMPDGVADKREIPDGCGIMLYRNGKVRVHKRAPWTWIEEWPTGFVACFGKRLAYPTRNGGDDG